jgi:O-methyltransferase involved in polyketide biosynthesis
VVSDVTDVRGVPATMLITVSARALADRLRPEMGFRDSAAEELVSALGIDPHEYCTFPPALVATVYRSKVFDRVTRSFCDRHASAVVFNLACGLATTYDRLDLDDQVTWIDVDLPEVVAVRRRFFADTPQRTAMVGDITDPALYELVADRAGGRPTLVLMEGILYYLGVDDVRLTFEQLAHALDGVGAECELAFDVASPSGVALSNARNTDTRRTRTEFQWGCRGFDELATWDPRLELIECSDHERFLPLDFAGLFRESKERDGVAPFAVMHARRDLQ